MARGGLAGVVLRGCGLALLPAAWVAAQTASPVGFQRVTSSVDAPSTRGTPFTGRHVDSLLFPASLAASRPDSRRPDSRRPTPWAILASAALAGSGQAILGQNRFVAYLAIETYAWVRYAADVGQGRRERTSYESLSAQVARAPFTTNPRVGGWDYYERMEHFRESGVFDAGTSGVFRPESDTTTYNGSIWLLARQTYWTDPLHAPDRSSTAWQSAERFYRGRAITPDRRWSWS